MGMKASPALVLCVSVTVHLALAQLQLRVRPSPSDHLPVPDLHEDPDPALEPGEKDLAPRLLRRKLGSSFDPSSRRSVHRLPVTGPKSREKTTWDSPERFPTSSSSWISPVSERRRKRSAGCAGGCGRTPGARCCRCGKIWACVSGRDTSKRGSARPNARALYRRACFVSRCGPWASRSSGGAASRARARPGAARGSARATRWSQSAAARVYSDAESSLYIWGWHLNRTCSCHPPV